MRVTANAKTRGRRFPKQSKERFSAFGAMRKTKNIRAISSADGDVKSKKKKSPGRHPDNNQAPGFRTRIVGLRGLHTEK
jgi:hypothetical protein